MFLASKNHINLILLFFLLQISHTNEFNYAKAGTDWPETCLKDGYQTPIDISPPFTYKKLDLEFKYSEMKTEYLYYHNGNNLILEGDFGYLKYDNKVYFSSEAYFFRPSSHTIGNHRFPLEMDVINRDEEGNIVTICILFKGEETAYSTLLGKLSFDNVNLKGLMPFAPIEVKQQIDLSKYIHEGLDYFHYDAVEQLPPCVKSNKVIILSDVIKCDSKQVDNFPISIFGNNRVLQYRYGRKIYLSFDYWKSAQEKIEKNKEMSLFNLEREFKISKIKLVEQLIMLKEKKNISKKEKKLIEFVDEYLENITNSKSTDDEEEENPLEAKQNLLDSINEMILKLENSNNAVNDSKGEKEKQSKEDKKEEKLSEDLIKKILINEKSSKKVQVNIIEQKEPKSDNIKMDKDLPKTDDFLTSEELIKEFDKWLKLKTEEKFQEDKINIEKFIELTNIEKKLIANNYQPYYDYVGVSRDNDNKKSSFILDSEKEYNFNVSNNYAYRKYYLKDDDNKNENEKLKEKYLNDKKEDSQNEINYLLKQKKMVDEKKSIKKTEFNMYYNINEDEKNDDLLKFINMKDNIKNYQKNKEFIKEKERFLEKNEPVKVERIVEKTVTTQTSIESFEFINPETSNNGKNNKEFIIEMEEDKKKIGNINKNISYKKENLLNMNIDMDNKESLKIKKMETILQEIPEQFMYIWNKYNMNIEPEIEIKDEFSSIHIGLLQLLFNAISQLCLDLDNKNIQNPFYYPYLNKNNKIKLSEYSISQILSFIYKLNNIKSITMKDKYNMLLKYIIRLIDKQNSYYMYYSITPVEYIFNYEEDEDISKIKKIFLNIVNSSDNLHLKNDTELSVAFMNTLLKSSPISIIDKETEHLESYNTYPNNKVDYLSLKYFRNSTVKNRNTNQNKVGSRSEGRLSYKTSNELNKNEDKYSFIYLEKEQTKCKLDLLQSPINIEGPYIAEEYRLNYNFKVPTKENGGVIISNENKVIKIKGKFGSFSHNKIEFSVNEVYVHYPSEHTYGENQTRAAMELQIVGKNKNKTAVIASLFDFGNMKNDLIASFGFDYDNSLYAKKLRNNENVVIDDENILNRMNLGYAIGINKNDFNSHFATYNGTLIYDNCQLAQWFVLEKRLSVTKLQLEYFSVLFGKNTNIRPLQLLNGRIIKVF